MRPIIGGADVAICHMEVPGSRRTRPDLGLPGVRRAGRAGRRGRARRATTAAPRRRTTASTRARPASTPRSTGSTSTGCATPAPPAPPRRARPTTFYEVGGRQGRPPQLRLRLQRVPHPGRRPVRRSTRSTPAASTPTPPRARAAGAELVVVSLHWGTEYRHDPDAYQRSTRRPAAAVGRHRPDHRPPRPRGAAHRAGRGHLRGVGAGQPALQPARGPAQRRAHRGAPRRPRRPTAGTRVAGIEAVPTWVEPGSFRVLPDRADAGRPGHSAGLRAELPAVLRPDRGRARRRPTPRRHLQPDPDPRSERRIRRG